MYKTFCETALAYLKLTGKWDYFDKAMKKIREAEEKILDPEITRIISRFESYSQAFKSAA